MKRFQLHPKLSFANVRELVEYAGEKHSENIAYSFRANPHKPEKTVISFSKLRDDVRALACAMVDMGLSSKHIGVIGSFTYEWAILYFATMSIGAVLCPLDAEWEPETLSQTLTYADCDCLFIDSKLSSRIDYITEHNQIIVKKFGKQADDDFHSMLSDGANIFASSPETYFNVRIEPDKLSLLVFTSGTTGKGKGVMLTQTSILADITNIMPYIDYGKKTVSVLPMHHTYGSTVMLLGHVCVGCEVYISSGLKYVAKELQEEKPEHMVLVPLFLETFYRKIQAGIKEKGMQKQVDLLMKTSRGMRKIGLDSRGRLFKSLRAPFGGKLHTIVCGGAPLNQEILHFFENIGLVVLNGYGITECSPVVAVNYSMGPVDGSVGRVLDMNKVKIGDLDENGIGEIYVKGSNVMLGYYKDEKATFDAIDCDGYFKTGDFGYVDDDNNLFITGRKKNIIILSNGKNVYPEEIESHIAEIDGTIDVVVFEGQSKRGISNNTIVAQIYPDKEYFAREGIEDIKAFYSEKISQYNKTAVPYKKIGLVQIRETEFPKNTLRKIKRFEIDTTID